MSNLDDKNDSDYWNIITHLLSTSPTLSGQNHDVARELSQKVGLATRGRAQLHLINQTSSFIAAVSFPIQFANRSYGKLHIAPDPVQLAYPALPFLTQTCGSLLYTYEVTTLLQGQYQQLDYQVHSPLTKQERNILLLMCRGKTKEEIAEVLSISPRTVSTHKQNIYSTLGVHSERDALLAAYQENIFSPLENIE